MAVLQPGFPLPRAKYLYFIFSSENISAKGFFRRGRSLSASRKKFGKGERYEEESHDTLYPLALRTLFNRNRRRGATHRNFHTSKARICGEEKKFGRIRALPCRMECAHSLRIGLLIHERNLSVSAPRYFELMNRNSLPPLISPSVVPLCPISAGIIRIDGKAGGKFRSQVDQVAGFASNFVYVCFAYVANKGESKGNVEKKRELQGERERES